MKDANQKIHQIKLLCHCYVHHPHHISFQQEMHQGKVMMHFYFLPLKTIADKFTVELHCSLLSSLLPAELSSITVDKRGQFCNTQAAGLPHQSQSEMWHSVLSPF